MDTLLLSNLYPINAFNNRCRHCRSQWHRFQFPVESNLSLLPQKKVLQDMSLFVPEKQVVVVLVNLVMQSYLSGFLTGNWMEVVCWITLILLKQVVLDDLWMSFTRLCSYGTMSRGGKKPCCNSLNETPSMKQQLGILCSCSGL